MLNTLLPKFDKVKAAKVRLVTLALASIPVLAFVAMAVFSSKLLVHPTSAAEFWTMMQAAAATLTLSATIGIAMVAWFGLRSIRLARNDMITRSTRESRALAIRRSEEFAEMLHGKTPPISAELGQANIAAFTKSIRSGAAIFDEPVFVTQARAWWKDVPGPTQTRIVHILNDMEAWSMYFAHGLADADVAYGPCAATFCSIVMQYAAWIVIARTDKLGGGYPNIVTLFKSWRSELDAQDRGLQTEAALRAAKAAEDRVAKHKLAAPLGTEIDE